MKRAKKLYIALGVLAVICIVTFCVSKYEKQKEVIKNSDEIILEIDSEKVESLSWENESESMSFHKDKKWIYDDDEAFPVNEEKINDLLEQFEEFGVSFIIEDVKDYGQYGLDNPVCTIKIKTKDKDHEIQLGDFSAMDSERYVSIGDGNVYLVKNDPFDSFDISLKDMIKHDEIPDFDKVKGIEFAGNETYKVTYEEDSKDTYCKEDVYFTKQDEKNMPLDTSLVDSYMETISQLGMTDYVSYNATDEELKTYGLDKPELSVSVQYTFEDENEKEKEDKFILNISRDPKEIKKAEKKESDDEDEEEINAYVRIGESKIIYKITSDEYKDLMDASYNSLRHQELFSAEFTDINQLDISLEDKNYSITSKGKSDKRKYYYKDEELEIADLQNAIEGLEADSFTDEKAKEKEEIHLTLHLDNDSFPKIEIVLYRYDGTNCLAEIDGKPIALVNRSKMIDLVEAVNAIVLE